jgi:glucuronyl/N-acetylglucosaminyl transferase EXT2
MIILDALQCGSIPVIISDDYLPPFHEVIDWSRFSILLAKQNLPELSRILNSISPETSEKMRQIGQRIYWQHLQSSAKVALSTLRLIERRILPVESNQFEDDVITNKKVSVF